MWYAPLPSIHSFPTRRSSDLHISALGALNGEEKWVQSIVDLMQACDDSIPDPVRETDKQFLMPIEDILDRKSTRLNSSHVAISYAVVCFKKTNIETTIARPNR